MKNKYVVPSVDSIFVCNRLLVRLLSGNELFLYLFPRYYGTKSNITNAFTVILNLCVIKGCPEAGGNTVL